MPVITRKIIAPLAAVLVILIVAASVYLLLSERPSVTQEVEITPPSATGNIDDAVGALLGELSDEGTLLTGEEGDATLVITDSQEVSNFGQSIDESEL